MGINIAEKIFYVSSFKIYSATIYGNSILKKYKRNVMAGKYLNVVVFILKMHCL